MRTKIPVTIFTGFLGSGKTTVILHLISDLAALGEKIVYIKNEVGESSTDALLLETQGAVLSGVKELTNGCICCTLTGQLYHAINELDDNYHPDRFIIESAGTAKPHDLALAISEHPRVTRDGVICVVDTLNFGGYERVDSVAQAQAAFTDLIVFNKVEFADEVRLRAVVGYVREVNVQAPIVEAPHGHVAWQVLCGIDSKLDFHAVSTNTHIADDQIGTLELTPKIMEISEYEKNIQGLPKNVLRIKGVINTPTGSLLVNTVNYRTTYQKLENYLVKPKLVLVWAVQPPSALSLVPFS